MGAIWELYWGVNNHNNILRNAYRRSMLFLTYIKGPDVTEWVTVMSRWLRQQVTTEGWDEAEEELWEEVKHAFNLRFINTMAKEEAQARLKTGFKMEKGNVDAYLSTFETLARKAGYDLNSLQSINDLTDGLPCELYRTCFQLSNPRGFKQWKWAILFHQQQWLHMNAKTNLNKFKTPTTRGSLGGQSNNWFPRNLPRRPDRPDPNTMDTSTNRIRAWQAEDEQGQLTGAEDIQW